MSETYRLNKRIVALDLAPSRRAADALIGRGVVLVNGTVAQLGTQVSTEDEITIDGKRASQQATPDAITIAFYKPVGYVCSHIQQGRGQTIFTLLPKQFATLKIAGRLDKDSQGLVILSSDGGLVHKIMHPSFEKEKEYIVSLNKPAKPQDIQSLLSGVKIESGISTFKQAKLLSSTLVKAVLTEGKNRQIRNTFAALDYTVKKLERIRIGGYSLGALEPGNYVFVQGEELEKLI